MMQLQELQPYWSYGCMLGYLFLKFFTGFQDVVKGRLLKTIMISAPNNGNTVDQNTEISASGGNVYVTWWINKTGNPIPVFRASNDNGDTFTKAIMLNSTR
jgi:hypothetical protein